MIFQRKSKSINISKQILGTLELIKNQIFSEFNALMSEEQAKECLKTGKLAGEEMPFAFIFAPKELDEVELKTAEQIELVFEGKAVGVIEISTIYEMKPEYEKNIFNTNQINKCEFSKFAISGNFELFVSEVREAKEQIQRIKREQNAKKITAIMLTADPLNRAHERIIRMTIDQADLVVIFLLQTYQEKHLNFELRREIIDYFIKRYLPENRVVVMPFKNTNLFSAHQNPTLEYLAAYRLGSNRLVLGQNHSSLSIFYDHNQVKSILDSYVKRKDMEIVILPELVYCNECKTLVSTRTCPHGAHHHIRYNPNVIKTLLFQGILPPAILVRPDVSAIVLGALFKDRFENLQDLCHGLFVNSGLLEKHTEREFYEELMRLYQTSSLT
ncbi:sulfate adenylyltransferase [Campylobacter sp. 9BO]|uniref:sulfate adenylyltransferase n=1 Tax=Campylobacter sp. 9BO TaxID=3424759 RepID=UPI003D33F93F